MSAKLSADLSILFDVGGIVGAIAAGVISDYTSMPASTCTGMLTFAVPMVRYCLSVSLLLFEFHSNYQFHNIY